MVKRYAKNGTAGALTVIAILLVAMAPLNLEEAKIRLPDLDENNVFADKDVIKQGETVTIGLTSLIRSEEVGIQYFVVDFHDNSGIYVMTTADKSISHRYTTVGTYPVSVLALRGNLSRMFTVPITVIPDTLDISIQANASNVVENQPISFEALQGNNIYSEVASYIWEFGDGTRKFGKNVIHNYNDSGIYTVKLRAYTNESVVYTDFLDITVNNKIPEVEVFTSTNVINENNIVRFTASPDDGLSDLSSLAYIWDFGDGEYASGEYVEHAFLNDGAFDVKDFFNFLEKNDIESAIRNRSNASTKAKGSMRRKKEVLKFKELGYKKWAEEKEYGMRWSMTEGHFSAIKRCYSDNSRGKKRKNILLELKRKVWIYNEVRKYGKL